ncbi:MAG: hypothetical protein PHI75_02450 [Bacilli bacterium]|jgi:hypothetical protein|nr:hypothetical protein [Bacilli bacterium]MDD3841560.1 hypothetical protein [Bacilli bacterium]HKM10301.1 hypothetical protein [Bacilli bacterium]
MITLIFYGLDQFVVGRLSRELTPLIAKLYEVEEDEVNFIAPNNMIFHKGTEQTSWNLLIHVHAPLKVSVLQKMMADLLLNGIGEVAIHKTVEFYYYSQDNRFQNINENYPRFITEDNLVDVDTDHDDEDLEEGEGDDQIYTGDVFKDFKPGD